MVLFSSFSLCIVHQKDLQTDGVNLEPPAAAAYAFDTVRGRWKQRLCAHVCPRGLNPPTEQTVVSGHLRSFTRFWASNGQISTLHEPKVKHRCPPDPFTVPLSFIPFSTGHSDIYFTNLTGEKTLMAHQELYLVVV